MTSVQYSPQQKKPGYEPGFSSMEGGGASFVIGRIYGQARRLTSLLDELVDLFGVQGVIRPIPDTDALLLLIIIAEHHVEKHPRLFLPAKNHQLDDNFLTP